MSDCFICCEPFNKSTRSKITCPNNSCNFTSCKKCTRQYLLSQKDSHCMNCKQAWSQKFIIENTNKSFFDNDYKKSRKQFLLENELSRLPATMAAAEVYKSIKEEEENIKLIDLDIKKLKKLIKDKQEHRFQLYRNIHKLKNSENKPNEEKKKFIMACPHDNCRGFLSTQYKCEICKLYTCPDCHEIIGHTKNDPHTCKEEHLQSAEFIKKDTKPCPNCGIRIFKISGCDQMWCTECEVAFSWNTGKQLYNVNIHNPHYYDRQRQLNQGIAPRNPRDILCGGLCNFYQLNSQILVIFDLTLTVNNMRPEVTNWHRFVNHMTNYELQRIRQKIIDLNNTEELRIKYILNEKTKDEVATCVYRNDTIRRKLSEISHIYELLSVVGIELFANLLNMKLATLSKEKAIFHVQNALNEYRELINYSNIQLQEISSIFNQRVIQIDPINFVMTTNKYNLIKKANNNSEASCSYH